MEQPINIVCVLRQGGPVNYDSTWVEKLQNMVSRNLTLPYKFFCLSDCEVPCTRVPLDPTSTKIKGWWAKLQLFKPELFNGPTLYFDLDTVIISNIDDMIKEIYNEKFIMWYEKDKGVHSSAMMWWNGDMSSLWNQYQENTPEHWNALYLHPPLYGDQGFISEHHSHKLFTDILPNEWFHISSKRDKFLDLSKVKILHFRKPNNKPSNYHHQLVKDHWK
jgi:hypothetical protein